MEIWRGSGGWTRRHLAPPNPHETLEDKERRSGRWRPCRLGRSKRKSRRTPRLALYCCSIAFHRPISTFYNVCQLDRGVRDR